MEIGDEFLTVVKATASQVGVAEAELHARFPHLKRGAVDYFPSQAATSEDVAALVDHTVLASTATENDVKKLCEEAKQYSFKAVCVNPSYAKLAKAELQGTKCLVACVCGFPLGASTTRIKAEEAKEAVQDGADEIDMVINVGWLLSGKLQEVYDDVKAVVEASKPSTVKAILECGALKDMRIIAQATTLALLAGVDFVKTSTGFGHGGAEAAHVRLMRSIVGNNCHVKASGGVRDIEAVRVMVENGADRIGTSSGTKIMAGMSEN